MDGTRKNLMNSILEFNALVNNINNENSELKQGIFKLEEKIFELERKFKQFEEDRTCPCGNPKNENGLCTYCSAW